MKLPPSMAGFLLAAVLLAPNNAWAYLDPGTGSFAFQMLAAGLLGAIFTVKSYWRTFMAAFKARFGRSDRSS